MIVVDARPDARTGTKSDGLVVGDCLLNHHGYLSRVEGKRDGMEPTALQSTFCKKEADFVIGEVRVGVNGITKSPVLVGGNVKDMDMAPRPGMM